MKSNFITLALGAAFAVGCGSGLDSSTGESKIKSNSPLPCSIQSHFGGYLTAVGGGGKTVDAIRANATKVQSWEKFTFVESGDGASPIHYGIKTVKGNYLTAVGGGGRISDVIHTDATVLSDWEKFTFNSLGNGIYSIQTINGHYLGHAGQSPDVLHSDATVANTWEKFRVHCGN